MFIECTATDLTKAKVGGRAGRQGRAQHGGKRGRAARPPKQPLLLRPHTGRGQALQIAPQTNRSPDASPTLGATRLTNPTARPCANEQGRRTAPSPPHKTPKVVLNTVVCMFSEYCAVPFEVEPVEVIDSFGESHGAGGGGGRDRGRGVHDETVRGRARRCSNSRSRSRSRRRSHPFPS